MCILPTNHISKTMRNFILSLSLLLISLFLPACLRAQQSETRDLPAFQSVRNGGSIKVTLQKGDKPSARIESEKIDLTEIITEVSDGELKIHFKPRLRVGWVEGQGAVRILVTYQSLNGIRNAGSGSITCEGAIQNEEINIKQSGSGRINIAQVEAGKVLDISVSGSGNVNISKISTKKTLSAHISGSGSCEVAGGAVGVLEAGISGSGKLDILGVDAENAKVKVSGSGRMFVSVAESLQARITGSGSVRYKTKPRSLEADISGSGRVRQID